MALYTLNKRMRTMIILRGGAIVGLKGFAYTVSTLILSWVVGGIPPWAQVLLGVSILSRLYAVGWQQCNAINDGPLIKQRHAVLITAVVLMAGVYSAMWVIPEYQWVFFWLIIPTLILYIKTTNRLFTELRLAGVPLADAFDSDVFEA